MFATLNASTKLPHCGCAGHPSPLGTVPDGWRAVMKMLMKGRIVRTISPSRSVRPATQLARPDLHQPVSRVRRWMGRMTTSTRTMSMTARADARPMRCSVNARM